MKFRPDKTSISYETNDYNKQRINLSEQAFSLLREEIAVFQPEILENKSEQTIPAEPINRIFQHYWGQAHASIEHSCRAERERMKTLMSTAGVDIGPDADEVIETLVNAYREKLKAEVNEHLNKKGTSFSIRVDKASCEILAAEDEGFVEHDYYDNRVGLYFKAILEEYFTLPQDERERIYRKDLLEAYDATVASGSILKLVLRTKSQPDGGNSAAYIRPYKVEQDSEHLYNYLVGLTSMSLDGPWEARSIRLSSVINWRILSRKKHLSKAEIHQIERALLQNGVQFLYTDEGLIRVVVSLTPEGKRMLQSIRHLRPKCIGDPYANPREFLCTRFQAINYFFQFGKEAKILEPKDLADGFVANYVQAANQYAND